MDWTLVTDEHGSEIAVHQERHGALVYPLALVAERWSDRRPGDLAPALTEIAARLDDLDG